MAIKAHYWPATRTHTRPFARTAQKLRIWKLCLGTIFPSPISAAAKYFIRTRRRHNAIFRYNPQESSWFHLQESLFTKHNIKHILCIAPGISHLQFNHGPSFSYIAFFTLMSSKYHPFSANCRPFCYPCIILYAHTSNRYSYQLLFAFHYLH